MPTLVGILPFMRRIDFMLQSLVHEKKFYNLEASCLLDIGCLVLFFNPLRTNDFFHLVIKLGMVLYRGGRLELTNIKMNCSP